MNRVWRTLRRVGVTFLFSANDICTADQANAPNVTVNPIKTALASAKPDSDETVRSGRWMFTPRFQARFTAKREI